MGRNPWVWRALAAYLAAGATLAGVGLVAAVWSWPVAAAKVALTVVAVGWASIGARL